MIADIFQDVLGDDYEERAVSFTIIALLRGSRAAHSITSDATFMDVLYRNLDERDPIHILVGIEEVITGNVSLVTTKICD